MRFSEVTVGALFIHDGEYRRKTGPMNYVIVGNEILGDAQEINLNREVEPVVVHQLAVANKVPPPSTDEPKEVRFDVYNKSIDVRSTEEALDRLDGKLADMELTVAKTKEAQVHLFAGLLPGATPAKLRKAAGFALDLLNEVHGPISEARVGTLRAAKPAPKKTPAKKATKKATKRTK